jgi:multidrug efflux system membrane fusion protein
LLGIPVAHPALRKVTDYVDFTGRSDAVFSVDIRARVTGFLVKVHFREGAEVRGDDRLAGAARTACLLAFPMGQGPLVAASSLFPGQCELGDLLFEIDPRPYQAQLDQALSQVNLNQASLRLAETTLARDRAIVRGGISQQQLDQEQAAVDEAKARVKASEASTEVYKLNLGYTKVTSPIDGQVSRYYLNVGNVVNQDQTLLTTVVSLDPMYVYFEMDEPTVLRIRTAVNQGRIKPPENGLFPVRMGLQGEDGFPHEGNINFVNNQFNPTTGSLAVRGVFANPKGPGGTRMLSPGMFVRIRLPIGQPHEELLVRDRYIGSDQGHKYVFVVDEENRAQYRRVTAGALQEDGLRVVDGLKPTDWVVVGALQQVRALMVVKPDRRKAMPSNSQPDTGEKDQETGKKP